MTPRRQDLDDDRARPDAVPHHEPDNIVLAEGGELAAMLRSMMNRVLGVAERVAG